MTLHGMAVPQPDLVEAPRRRLSSTFTIQTQRAPQFIDITARVAEAVYASGVVDGAALVFSPHTTAAIVINEHEPLLIKDMEAFLTSLAPPHWSYRHDDFSVRTVNMTPDEVPNGHAHCQHLVLPSSEFVPIEDGELGLGRWQRIFLVELDRPRRREVVVKIMRA
jgi:secondary thiamine-phosphate synthase enzyme